MAVAPLAAPLACRFVVTVYAMLKDARTLVLVLAPVLVLVLLSHVLITCLSLSHVLVLTSMKCTYHVLIMYLSLSVLIIKCYRY